MMSNIDLSAISKAVIERATQQYADQPDFEHPPMVVFFNSDNQPFGSGMMPMGDQDEKHAAIEALRSLVDTNHIRGYAIIVESWLSTSIGRDQDGNIIPPSQSQDRQEILVVSFYFPEFSSVSICDIERGEKTTRLSEREIPKGTTSESVFDIFPRAAAGSLH